MEITPNSSNSNSASVAILTADVKQLVQNYANKPLLIEKLVLNRAQGLLLRLVNDSNKLSLQLPIELSDSLKSASQSKLQITIALSANHRVLIYLSSRNTSPDRNNHVTSPTKPGQLSLSLPSALPQPSNLLQQSALPENLALKANRSLPAQSNQPTKPAPIIFQFQKAQSSNQENLKLSSVKPATLSQIKLLSSLVPDDLELKTYLSDINRGKANRSQQAASSSEIKNTVDLPTLNSKNEIAKAANQILKSHFSNQQPISKHLSKLRDLTLQIQSNGQPTKLEIKLVSQIEQLIESIKISSQPTASNIKQRVFASGNFLETNSKILAEKKQEVISVKKTNMNRPTEGKLFNSLSPSTSPSKTQIDPKRMAELSSRVSQSASLPNLKSHKTPTDLKLQLLQIKTSLETLISEIVKGGIINSKQPIARAQQQVTQSVTQANSSELTSKESTALTPNNPLTNPKTDVKLDPLISGLSAQIKFARKTTNQRTAVSSTTILNPLKELLAEVKNIVSQIENHQLQTLKNEQPNLHQILVDLPFGKESDIDSFEMLFENNNEDMERSTVKAWKVVVRFDLEPLGPMFAQVELENERLSTHIFSKSKQTAQLIDDHMHVLKKSLFNAGVDVNELKSSQGNIPEKLILNDEGKVDLHI